MSLWMYAKTPEEVIGKCREIMGNVYLIKTNMWGLMD